MQKWFKDGRLVTKNGQGLFCNKCPCVCPHFDGRVIAYVDKKASGANNGTLWADAYTDIQTAIDNDSRKEIQIQGYGESDCYPAGVELLKCTYLKGVGDVWLDGETITDRGLYSLFDSTRVDLINVKNCRDCGFKSVGYLNNCVAENIGADGIFSWAFYSIISANSCIARKRDLPQWDTCGFSHTSSLHDCHAINMDRGFSAVLSGIITDCSATNCSSTGFHIDADMTVIDCAADSCNTGFVLGSLYSQHSIDLLGCIAKNNQYNGFWRYGPSSGPTTFTNCTAFNNQQCGFTSLHASLPSYINCTQYNNCLSGNDTCSPGGMYYWCDEV